MIISQNIGEGRFHVGKRMFTDVRRGRRPATFFSGMSVRRRHAMTAT